MSTTHERLTARGSATERIEQAIARGLTVTRICDTLGVSADKVHAVWDRLDELDDEDPVPDPDAYTVPDYSAELANERRTVTRNAAAARSRRSLTEQVVDHPRGETCGSHAAYVAHHRKWEPIDPLCCLAERLHRRVRARAYRAKARAAA